jgi:hypothetical protein
MQLIGNCYVSFKSENFGSGKIKILENAIVLENEAKESLIVKKEDVVRSNISVDSTFSKKLAPLLLGWYTFGAIGAAITANKMANKEVRYIELETKMPTSGILVIAFLGSGCPEYQMVCNIFNN